MAFIRSFFKWFLVASVLMAAIILTQYFAGNIAHNDYLLTVKTALSGAAILGVFLAFVELVLVPWRKELLTKKIAKQFSGKIIDADCTTFLLGTSLVYANVHIKLKFAANIFALEFVEFSSLPIDMFSSAKPTKKEQLSLQEKATSIHTCSPKKLAKAEIVLRKNLDSIDAA